MMNGLKYDSCQLKLNFELFYSLVLSLLLTSIRAELTNIIETNEGPVQGTILTTILNSISYSSFKGIPYAKPPIGNLRFKPPEKAESWNETLLASKEYKCPQIFSVNESEDCLYLNVYTPKVDFNRTSEKLMPVMVWLHGGKFKFGHASFYGPDHFIEEKVVMVATNFRLGALGHLALGITGVTGNSALKDQILAFKWVKRNIMKFGGDPNLVTIFGQSSGSSYIDLHLISNASRGLFHRSISLSGSPFNPWAFSTPKQAEVRALHLANLMGIKTINSSETEIFLELSKKSAKELVIATENITKADREFKPTIENSSIAGETAFLTECPATKFKNGDFARLPHMTGFVANEMILFAGSVEELIYQTEFALSSMSIVLHNQVGNYLSAFLERLSNNSNGSLSDFPDDFIMGGINVLSDVLTVSGIDTKQQLMAAYPSAPVYYYKMSFNAGSHSFHRKMENIRYNGTGHGDENAALFHIPSFEAPLNPDDPYSILRRRIVRMFANFAKYGNPTPDGLSDSLLNITWPVSGKEGLHMEIAEILSIGGRPINDNVKIIEEAQLGGQLEILSGC